MNRNRPTAGTDRAAQNAQTLKALVKLESNKVCADCKRNKHPRWASWNLGVFVCIRCSGIHRGLGTHISRVKSVDLDAWTDEQLQSILRWGNARANKYWEAKLQTGHVPSESKMDNFIRTKYESKRWVMDGPMPDPATLGDDDDVPLNVVQEKAKIERSASLKQSGNLRQPPQPATQVAAPRANVNLFDDDFDVPARPSTTDVSSNRQTQPAAQPAPRPAAQSSNLMGLDFFGASQPAGVGRPSSVAANPSTATNTRNDLKSSILSLYANAPKPQPAAQPTHDRQPSYGSSFGGPASPSAPKPDAFGGLAGAFGGLTFSNPSASITTSPPAQSSSSAFGFPTTSSAQSPTSAFAGLNFATTVPPKAAPSIPQVTSPPPLGGGNFFSSTATKPPAPKPGAASQPTNNLNFAFTQTQSPSPSIVKPSTASMPTDLFGDDGFSSFAAPVKPQKSPPPQYPSPPMQSPPSLGSAFNLSSAKPTPAVQAARPAMAAQSSANLFDPWGGADTNAWGAPEPAKPVAPKVELGRVPSRITPNDIGGGWGQSASTPAVSKPTRQASITADEDFGGWASAATPAATKSSGGMGASDPFDNPWG